MSARRGSKKTTRRKRSQSPAITIDPMYQTYLRDIAAGLDAGTADAYDRGVAAEILRQIANSEDVRQDFLDRRNTVEHWERDERGNLRRKRGRHPKLDIERAEEVRRADAFLRKKLAEGHTLKAAMSAARREGFTARALRKSREKK